jgi:hypothetical protein
VKETESVYQVEQQRVSPSTPPLEPNVLASVLERNIDALRTKRHEDERQASLQDRIAEIITRFSGSMAFVYVHLALVASWVAINLNLIPAIPIARQSGSEERGDLADDLLSRWDDDCRAAAQMQALS